MIHYLFRTWSERYDIVILLLQRVFKVLTLQRKKLQHLRLHIHGIYHLGVNNINLVKIFSLKKICDSFGDRPRPVKGRILSRVKELSVDGHVLS